MIILQYISTALLCIQDMGIAVYFMNTFFKRKARIFYIILLVLLNSTGLFLVNVFRASVSLNALITILHILVLSYFYQTNLTQKVICLLAIMTIGLIPEAFAADFSVSLGAMTYTKELIYFLNNDKAIIFLSFSFIGKSFSYLIIFIFGMWHRDWSEIFENYRIRIQYLLMMVVYLLCLLVVTFTNNAYFSEKASFTLSLFVNFAMISCTTIIFVVFYQMAEIDKLMYEKKMLQEEYQLKQTYYQELNAHQQEIRKIRHDMKNELLGIMADLSDETDTKSRLHQLMDKITSTEKKVYCENPPLNTLLNVKLNTAQELDAVIQTDIKTPPQLNIDFGDLGILLGNILDNAITALKECPPKQRTLELKLYFFNNCLILICENSVSKKVTNLLTTKKDALNHGLGLKSINEIVRKYNGQSNIISTDSTFKIEINIWLQ